MGRQTRAPCGLEGNERKMGKYDRLSNGNFFEWIFHFLPREFVGCKLRTDGDP